MSYKAMAIEAIAELADRTGSSAIAIEKYILCVVTARARASRGRRLRLRACCPSRSAPSHSCSSLFTHGGVLHLRTVRRRRPTTCSGCRSLPTVRPSPPPPPQGALQEDRLQALPPAQSHQERPREGRHPRPPQPQEQLQAALEAQEEGAGEEEGARQEGRCHRQAAPALTLPASMSLSRRDASARPPPRLLPSPSLTCSLLCPGAPQKKAPAKKKKKAPAKKKTKKVGLTPLPSLPSLPPLLSFFPPVRADRAWVGGGQWLWSVRLPVGCPCVRRAMSGSGSTGLDEPVARRSSGGHQTQLTRCVPQQVVADPN